MKINLFSKSKFSYLLLFAACSIIVSQSQAQSLLNTTWMAAGALGIGFNNSGFDSLRINFLPGNKFQYLYNTGTNDTMENGVWWQIDNNHMLYVDTSSFGLGSVCGKTDTFFIGYTINLDTLTMDSSTGGCAFLNAIYVESEWSEVGANAGVTDPRKSLKQMLVYPDPAENELHINRQEEKIESAKIISVSGQLIMQPDLTGGDINISQLPSDIYLIEIKTANNIYWARFVKE